MATQGPHDILIYGLIEAAKNGKLSELQRFIVQVVALIENPILINGCLVEAFHWAAARGHLDIVQFFLSDELRGLFTLAEIENGLRKSIIYGHETTRDFLLKVTNHKLIGMYPNDESHTWCDTFVIISTQSTKDISGLTFTKVFIPNFVRLRAAANPVPEPEPEKGFYVGEIFCQYLDGNEGGKVFPPSL